LYSGVGRDYRFGDSDTDFFYDLLVFVHLRKRKFIPNCAGDIESRPFMEALSQFSYRAGNVC